MRVLHILCIFLQYISTLVILLFAFVVGAVCVIILVISTRKSQHQMEEGNYDTIRYRSRHELETSSLVRRNNSTNAVSVADDGDILITSSQEPKADPQTSTFKLNIQKNGSSVSDSQSSSDSSSQLISEKKERPLLDNHSKAEAAVTGFGTLPSAGVWAKDTSGTQLTRFVVLLIFLLFSCLVVSICILLFNSKVVGFLGGELEN